MDRIKEIPDNYVHCTITSPPYWGLRDYGVVGQLGLEKTPEEYIEKMVAVFREVRRVMRPDATFWLNMGDSYAGGGRGFGYGGIQDENKGCENMPKSVIPNGLKLKDLCMMPARLAIALQADGWWLRSDIIWNKSNPMPENVTDRPAKSYDHIFLLTKSAKYFYDATAVREKGQDCDGRQRGKICYEGKSIEYIANPSGRNCRDVWTFATQPHHWKNGAHYATFPDELPLRCIKAGTSEKGVCPECGKQWARIIKKERITRPELPESDPRYRPNIYDGAYKDINGKGDCAYSNTQTLGWRPSCKCDVINTAPAIVFDPFMGSGTTAYIAHRMGRDYLGIELNADYMNLFKERQGLQERLI